MQYSKGSAERDTTMPMHSTWMDGHAIIVSNNNEICIGEEDLVIRRKTCKETRRSLNPTSGVTSVPHEGDAPSYPPYHALD